MKGYLCQQWTTFYLPWISFRNVWCALSFSLSLSLSLCVCVCDLAYIDMEIIIINQTRSSLAYPVIYI